MVRGLALLAVLSLDIPPEPGKGKGCSIPADGAPIALSALVLVAVPLLLRRRIRQPA
jgi:hypothetical protein